MMSEKNGDINNGSIHEGQIKSIRLSTMIDSAREDPSKTSIGEQLSLVKHPNLLFSDKFTESLSPELQVYISDGKKCIKELDKDSSIAFEEIVKQTLKERDVKVDGTVLYISALGVMKDRKCSFEQAIDALLGPKVNKEKDREQDASKTITEPSYEEYKKFGKERYDIRFEAMGNFFKDLALYLADYLRGLSPEEAVKLKSINSVHGSNIDQRIANSIRATIKKTGKDVMTSNIDSVILDAMFHVFRHDESRGEELYQKTKRALNSIGAMINDRVDYKHFDPEYDEVIEEETSKYPPGTVIEVLSPGLKIRKDDGSFKNHKSRRVKLSRGPR